IALAGLATGVVAVRRQARRAEYRFRQVRGLAHTVLFDLNPAIENLTGSMKARELLVTTSLRYLDSLATEAVDDPSLQLELAEAYEKVADVQGYSKVPNLGHPEAALQSYDKALRTARRVPPSRAVLELVARTYSKIGYVQGWEIGRPEEALKMLHQGVRAAEAVPAATGDPEYELRAEAYGLLGDGYRHTQPERSTEPYRRSLAIAREWWAARPSAKSRIFLSRATARWGIILWETGDLNGAIAAKREALGIVDELRREQPANAMLRLRRDSLVQDIGIILGVPSEFNLGDPKAAAVWLQEALNDWERMAAADPDDLDARDQSALAASQLAAVIGASDPPRAERLFRHALELFASVVQTKPEDTDSQDDQASARMELAGVLWRLGRSRDALTELNAAVETKIRLWKNDSDHLGFGLAFGDALNTRAKYRLEAGDRAGSEEDLKRSLAALEPIFGANPHNLTALQNLAECHQGLGDLAASRSDWKRAESEYQKSLDLWNQWRNIATTSVYDQKRRDAAALLVARAAKESSLNPSTR
ncbi:MAG TPA: serine/threonine protein kinase, partial [Thermoanaerobaculia bacterium]|nr:serine/threonine protein kinase [Thermoanaerobaculia bacterium]